MKLKAYYICVLLLCTALLVSLAALFSGLYKKTQIYCDELSPVNAYTQDIKNFNWDEMWQDNAYPYDEEDGV